MKTLLILLDGLGDRSYDDLGGRTPLEAAGTPNMDRLAAMGACGLFHASFPGQCLPSELAHFLLFGYDAPEFPGRGLLEASGDDIPFSGADVLVLAHLSGVKPDNGRLILKQGRDDLSGIGEDFGRVFSRLSPREINGITFRLRQTRRNDAILVMSGDVSPDVSDSDPITRGKPMAMVVPVSGTTEPEKARKTADAMNTYLAWCHEQMSAMSEKPEGANFLATQRCGKQRPLEPFSEKWGMRGAIIASPSIYHGLAREIGLDSIRVRDTQDPGADLGERIDMALNDTSHEFIHVHTKTPDEAGHKGGPADKREIIEALDSGMGRLVSAAETKELLVVVTGDHSTPCRSTLIHSGEPVPVLMAGPGIRKDRVERFDEISVCSGGLSLLKGRELMSMILNAMGRASLAGLCLGKRARPYDPDQYPAFELPVKKKIK